MENGNTPTSAMMVREANGGNYGILKIASWISAVCMIVLCAESHITKARKRMMCHQSCVVSVTQTFHTDTRSRRWNSCVSRQGTSVFGAVVKVGYGKIKRRKKSV